jgi:hypothetical protein
MQNTFSLLLVVLLLAVVGCGEPTTREDESSRESAPDSGQPSREVASNAEQSDQERFDAALERFNEGTYTIRYESTIPDMPGSVVMELYTDGEGRQRVDTRFEAGDDMPTSSLISIKTPSRVAICTESVGAFALFAQLRDRSCIDAATLGEAVEEQLVSQSPLSGPLAAEDGRVTGVSERTIGGEDAECFSLSMPADLDYDAEDYEVCFGESGALLAWGVLGEEEAYVTATEASTSVDEEVFELPYPVITLATLEIHNNAGVPIFVNAHSKEYGDWIDGDVEIDAGDTGTLQAGAGGDPVSIYLGTYESPQWSWSCTWEDAKANEPLIVTDGSANCTDTSSN